MTFFGFFFCRRNAVNHALCTNTLFSDNSTHIEISRSYSHHSVLHSKSFTTTFSSSFSCLFYNFHRPTVLLIRLACRHSNPFSLLTFLILTRHFSIFFLSVSLSFFFNIHISGFALFDGGRTVILATQTEPK